MKILLVSWVDLGGTDYRTAQSLRSAGIEVKQVTFKTHMGYPLELYVNPKKKTGMKALEDLLGWADVVQVQEFWMKAESLGILGHRRVVYHPLGTTHRRTYAEANRWMDKHCAGAYCSEITAYYFGGGRFKYIEIPYPESAEKAKFSLPLRVIHAPTSHNRFAVKNTPIVQAAFIGMPAPARLVLVHDVKNEECMRIKKTCNVLIDQPGCFGGGMNSVEAWSLGMPVVTGFSGSPIGTRNWRRIAAELYGEIPFVTANGNGDRLVTAVADCVTRLTEQSAWEHWAETGKSYFRRFHEEKAVGQQLAAFFRGVVEQT